jgi:hypothetical protein
MAARPAIRHPRQLPGALPVVVLLPADTTVSIAGRSPRLGKLLPRSLIVSFARLRVAGDASRVTYARSRGGRSVHDAHSSDVLPRCGPSTNTRSPCDRVAMTALVSRFAAVRSVRSSRRPGVRRRSHHTSYDTRTRSSSFIRGCRSTSSSAGSDRSTSRRPRQPDHSHQTAAAGAWKNPPRGSHQRSARTRQQRRNDRQR